MVSRDDPVVIPDTCDYVTLHGKEFFADGNSVLNYPGGLCGITKILKGWKSQTGGAESERCPDAAGSDLKVGEEDQGPRNTSGP